MFFTASSMQCTIPKIMDLSELLLGGVNANR